MNEKHKLFAEEYLKDCNATAAAERAGYSKATARTKGSALFNTPEIHAYINKMREGMQERTEVTADYVIRSLQLVAERCMQGEPVMVFDGEGMVESGEWKFDSSGANKSLELLGKHLGIFEKDNSQKKGDGSLTPEQYSTLLLAARAGIQNNTRK